MSFPLSLHLYDGFHVVEMHTLPMTVHPEVLLRSRCVFPHPAVLSRSVRGEDTQQICRVPQRVLHCWVKDQRTRPLASRLQNVREQRAGPSLLWEAAARGQGPLPGWRHPRGNARWRGHISLRSLCQQASESWSAWEV